jgi:SNF2 family DNA or RNA helicase
MYELGQWIKKKENGQRVQVLEVFETWGYSSLKIYNPEENKIEFLSANRVLEEWDQEIDGDYIKYKIVLLKLLQEISQGMLTSLKEGVIPLPHQLYVLKRVLSESRIRYVLADEVGLGKTIEAGLIIRELKARGLIKRILIVCPKGLVSQWNLELKEKFDEYFNIILPSEYETIKRIINKDQVYSQFDQVISPMDSIKPIERRAGWTQDEIKKYNEERIYSIIEADWDLIIIDEAHRMAGSSDQVARYKLGKMLSKASPYLLLLTATPHSGKTDQFLRLLGFLDQDAFPNYQSLIKENVSQYIIRTEKREAIDNKGERLFRDRKTHLVEVKWDEKHSNQSRLYEMVTEYVKKGYNRAIKEKKSYVGFLMVLMQRLVTSSTAAIKDSISRRIEILESQQVKIHNLSFDDLADMDFEEGMGQALELASIDIKNEIKDLKEILALAKQAEYQAIDAKAERLLDYLDELYSKDNEMKAIIFTEFVETQNYLRMFLHNKGYSISILNGSMDMEERDRILLEFKDDNNILISTDTGGEGLNLQFANIVINYDLPWNPMKIEQRIGRVDRIGQVKDVLVYNFINIDTVENRVRSILESKLATILDETGINKLSDLLDNVTQAFQKPAFAMVPYGIPDAVAGEDFREKGGNSYFAEDLAKAKQLLAEAGYPDGKGLPEIKILYNTNEAHQKIAEAIMEMWKQNLGVKVSLSNQEWQVYLNSRKAGDYQVARAGWGADYTDAMTFLDMWMTDNGNNQTNWGSAEYDRLIKVAKSEADPEIRIKAMHDAEKILMTDMPIMPIYFYTNVNMYKSHVKGVIVPMVGGYQEFRWAYIEE